VPTVRALGPVSLPKPAVLDRTRRAMGLDSRVQDRQGTCAVRLDLLESISRTTPAVVAN
jgi:hypothetical protein